MPSRLDPPDMAEREQMLALAERCEKTSGPDRRLDVLIGCAVRQMPESGPNAFLETWPLPFVPSQFSGRIAAPDNEGNTSVHWEAREFTASLDAALTLVPEGCGVTINRYWTAAHDAPVWSAELATGGIPEKPRQVFDCYDAATPALALCAASLRARGDGQPRKLCRMGR